jgi:hypothetical protein
VLNTSSQLDAAIGAALLIAEAEAVDRIGHGPAATGDRAAVLVGAVAVGPAAPVALSAARHGRASAPPSAQVGQWSRWYAEAIPRAKHLYEIYLKERAGEEAGE